MSKLDSSSRGKRSHFLINVFTQIFLWLIDRLSLYIIAPLYIVEVSLVFLFSYEADTIVLNIINLLFGSAVKKQAIAQTTLEVIKNFSLNGTKIGFILTQAFVLCLLFIVYFKVFFRISEDTRGNHTEHLKTKAKKLGKDTLRAFDNVTRVTIFFIIAILAVRLLQWGINDEAFGVIAAVIIAIFYVLAYAISLIAYMRDLFNMLKQFNGKEEEVS